MIRWFRSRRPTPPQPVNPATLLDPADIAIKTVYGYSTQQWLDLTPEQRRAARLGVAAQLNQRNRAA